MSDSVSRPLLSRATILILSGWLAGVASSGWLVPTIRPAVFCAAFAGLVAYVGLEYTARLHRRSVKRRKDRRVAEKLERQCESLHTVTAGASGSSPHRAG